MPKSTHTDEYGRFRRLLVEARKSAGFSQAELANRLGKPQSYVSKFERGERRLDVVEFRRVADAIGIDWSGLLHKLWAERGGLR